MELLILLAASKAELVTRAEIAERLWDSEVFVDTEHGINTAIRKIRQVLRDDPEEPRFVQTVTGKGYRFIGPVVAIRASPPPGTSARSRCQHRTTASPSHRQPPASSPPAHALRLALARSSALAALVLAHHRRHPVSHLVAARIRRPHTRPPSRPSPSFPSTISPAIPPRTTSPTA